MILPKHMEYANINKRLQSFSTWLDNHPLKKEVAAEAGLYFTGESDCIRCYVSGGGLRKWEPADDVWVEHARWFPRCQLVQETLGHEFVEAVGLLGKHHPQVSMEMVKNYLNLQQQQQSHDLD